jgi:hypothetical protein
VNEVVNFTNMLAYSVIAGQLIGRTKEAIQNLATGRNDSNYDLFDENGET